MLPPHCHHRVRIDSQADLATARGISATLLARAELDADATGRFQLILAELGSNLIRHAGGGLLLLRCLRGEEGPGLPLVGIECLALDNGPGIGDLDHALADRPQGDGAAGGSLGYGLGSIRRLSDRFAIHSRPQAGTVIMARVWNRHGQGRDTACPFPYGAILLPMAGCDDCGDGWATRADGLAMLVDGLGHGGAAGLVARQAEAAFMALPPGTDPGAAVATLHRVLRGSRGAAVAVARLRPDRLEFAGVGNITATLVSRSGNTTLNSRWGVVGYNAVPPPATQQRWAPGDHLLVHSDGFANLVAGFAGTPLRHLDPTLAAALLLRDGPGRIDDQTILILANPTFNREKGAGGTGREESHGPAERSP